MANEPKPTDHKPIQEGIFHGPFPPPELDKHPISAGWIADEAKGDDGLYQLLMQREEVIEAKANRIIDEESYDENFANISNKIGWMIGRIHLREITKTRPYFKHRK